MLKITVAVLAVALAGTASAGGWRSLRIDGSSEASFAESMEAFKGKLPSARRYVFVFAMREIWVQGVETAKATDREYTAIDYFRQTHGLGYDEVVTLLDPTGQAARARYHAASRFYARAPDLYFGDQQSASQNWPESFTYQTPAMIEAVLQPAQ